MDAIFIPGQVPSSKNSRVTNTKTGRTFPSKNTQEYKKSTLTYWQFYRGKFMELTHSMSFPLMVGFFFVRKDKRRFDWVNPVQTIQDLMVDHEWLSDDNSTIMVPLPLLSVSSHKTFCIDSNNPGVYIKPFHLNEGIYFKDSHSLL